MGRKRNSPEAAVDHFDLELTFDHRRDKWCDVLKFWRSRSGKHIVVGYLCVDESCDNPLMMCDGNGRILTKHLDRSFLQHVGRDTDGEPLLEECAAIMARLKGVELDGVECDGEALRAMWDEMSRQGKVGTPYARALSFLNHRGYVESSEGHRWAIDGVWIPDDTLLEHINSFPEEHRREEAERCFRQALEEHNLWVTGECYGVVVDVFAREARGEPYERMEGTCEAVWGFVGREHAEDSLDDEFDAMKEWVVRPRTKISHAA